MKTILKLSGVATAAALLFAAVSCDASLETTYAAQETKIDNFINGQLSKNEDMYVVRNGGANRLVITEGEGEEATSDATVSILYGAYTFSGSFSKSNLITTNSEDMAKDAGWKAPDDETGILTVNLKEDQLIEGLKYGLRGVKGGEKCYIIFSGKYAFGKAPFGTIPANSAMLWQIVVESISND